MADQHFPKLFSADEANSLIPRLEVLIRDLQDNAGSLRERIQEFAATDDQIESMRLQEIVELHPELKGAASRMAEIVGEIEELGCYLKDIDLGLIDFATEMDDDVVFLCWQYGEQRVLAWHSIDSGFAHRRPLPDASKPYLN
ncbi:MAG TPA: DUF2203 domain-containing protein [Candidatus Binataceae bacterium]|nr:DUF2203 domain-containing protein [Candidatus Binataceae bacterium]